MCRAALSSASSNLLRLTPCAMEMGFIASIWSLRFRNQRGNRTGNAEEDGLFPVPCSTSTPLPTGGVVPSFRHPARQTLACQSGMGVCQKHLPLPPYSSRLLFHIRIAGKKRRGWLGSYNQGGKSAEGAACTVIIIATTKRKGYPTQLQIPACKVSAVTVSRSEDSKSSEDGAGAGAGGSGWFRNPPILNLRSGPAGVFRMGIPCPASRPPIPYTVK